MTDPIRLARPDVGDAELAALAEVVGTGQLTMGPKVEEFEAGIANAVGTAHAAAVSSGTAALHLALLALELGQPGPQHHHLLGKRTHPFQGAVSLGRSERAGGHCARTPS